jgi:diguanylate cyclase (GGDEF)-like protein
VERDASGRPRLVAGAHRDISDQVRNEERLLDLSIRDPLTGIFNRRRVLERLGELMARYARGGEPISVALFDIDRFKSINDGYGHQAGDQAIRDFAAILHAGVREYDVVGRYGGEEFLAILDGSDAASSAAVVERILATLRSHVTVHDEAGIRFTVSAGIACSSELERSTLSEGALLGLADARLYCAKEVGRDRVVWRSFISGGCELE